MIDRYTCGHWFHRKAGRVAKRCKLCREVRYTQLISDTPAPDDDDIAIDMDLLRYFMMDGIRYSGKPSNYSARLSDLFKRRRKDEG